MSEKSAFLRKSTSFGIGTGSTSSHTETLGQCYILACKSTRYHVLINQCFPCVVMHVIFSVEPVLPFEVARKMESGDVPTVVAQRAILMIHISGY